MMAVKKHAVYVSDKQMREINVDYLGRGVEYQLLQIATMNKVGDDGY